MKFEVEIYGRKNSIIGEIRGLRVYSTVVEASTASEAREKAWYEYEKQTAWNHSDFAFDCERV